MNIKKILKQVGGGVRFTVSRLLFFVIGIGVSLMFYGVYAAHPWSTDPFVSAGNAGTTLSSAAWNKLVANDESFHNRIYNNEHSIDSINTLLSLKAPLANPVFSGTISFTSGTGPLCIFQITCPTGWIDKGLGGYIYADAGSTCPYTLGGDFFSSGWHWCHPKICCNS